MCNGHKVCLVMRDSKSTRSNFLLLDVVVNVDPICTVLEMSVD